MTATLEFDFPIWFQATPLKHRTPKIVSGIFRETFDVPDVDPADVNPVMTLEIAGKANEFFEIDGRFYRAVGRIDDEATKLEYRGEKSPIPCVRTEFWEMKNVPQRKAKEAGLALFPKYQPETGDEHPLLYRDMFSETDLGWIDRRRDEAFEYLSAMRVSGGILYQPMPEPAFIVSMSTDGTRNSAVSVDFQASNSRPVYTGYPVAYFRADQQEEALSYASALAGRYGARAEHVDRRAIEIQDGDRLGFDPYPCQILEAASLVMIVNRNNSDGDKCLAQTISEILGPDADTWRQAAAGTFGEGEIARLETIVRDSLEQGKTAAPAVLVSTLLERWDERPIELVGLKVSAPTR